MYFTIFSITLVSTTFTLTVLFGRLVATLKKKKTSPFAVKLGICMMTYNLAYLIRFGVGRVLDEGKDQRRELGAFYISLGVLWILLTVAGLLSFNLGSWYFGFHYFKCASEIKLIAT